MVQRIEVSKRIIAINSVASLVQPVLAITVLLWLNQFLVNRISLDELAIYYVVQALVVYMPLVQMIVSGGIARFCTEAYAKGNDRRMTEIVSTMTPLCVATALVLLIGGLAVSWFIGDLLTIAPDHLADARLQLALSVVMTALQIATLPFGVGFKVRQKYMWENVIGLGSDLLRYALMFALLFGVSTRALWVVVAGIPPQLLALTLRQVISRRLVPSLHFDRNAIRRDLMAPLLSFQAWNVLARTATLLRTSFTQPLLNELGSAAQVVSYRIGSIVESRFFPIALSPLGNVQTILVAFHATGQKERLRNHYLRYCRYVLWAFLFVSVPFVCYRAELWEAYLKPAKYAELWQAGVVAALLLAKSVFVFNQPVVAQVALAQAKNRPLTIRTFVIEMTTAAAIWVTVQRGGGPIGVALTTLLVAAVLTPALHWTFGLQLTETRFSVWLRRSILPGMLPAAVALPVGFLGHYLLAPTGWLQVLPHVAAVELLYVAVVYAFAMDDGERADVRKVLLQVRARFLGTKPAPAE
jgi:O-antigen/teichoic acid export membrane protein